MEIYEEEPTAEELEQIQTAIDEGLFDDVFEKEEDQEDEDEDLYKDFAEMP